MRNEIPFSQNDDRSEQKNLKNRMTSVGLNPKPYLKHKPGANRALC